MNYSIITIIYNPNSTGFSKPLARKLESQLRKRLPAQKIEVVATERMKHAEELAYSIARSSKNPLIISSSGDGGYHEVVNGAIKAQLEGAHPTVGLLPAGNANDHYKNLHEQEIVDQIIKNKFTKIDLLKMTYQSKGKKRHRYAHSYIGFGITPIIGKELNKTDLNFFAEISIVIRSLFTIKPVRLKLGNKKARYYESVIISNIDVMSKYLKISEPSSVTDGKFEVTIFKRRSKLKLILTLLKASLVGVEENAQLQEYSLKTVNKTLVQADGEVLTVDPDSKVLISIEKQMLRSVV